MNKKVKKPSKRGMSPKQAAEIWQSETKLKDLRVKKGLSQEELAVKSGISKSTIICYEHQTRPIDGARLNALCDLSIALGCKIEDLLESEELIKKYKKVK